MSKFKKVFFATASFGLLLAGLISCGGGNKQNGSTSPSRESRSNDSSGVSGTVEETDKDDTDDLDEAIGQLGDLMKEYGKLVEKAETAATKNDAISLTKLSLESVKLADKAVAGHRRSVRTYPRTDVPPCPAVSAMNAPHSAHKEQLP